MLLPYLPDPLAIGVSLTGYDFTGAEVFHERAHFADAWPELKPFRLRLSEGPLGAEFTGGVLEVRLPKAEVVWARLASVFPDGRLEDLAIWQWIAPRGPDERAGGGGRGRPPLDADAVPAADLHPRRAAAAGRSRT